jgi:Uma2 family endonuclease
MSTQAAKERPRYTYEDYLNFPDDIRCEIIDGEIYDMTPSPTSKHQLVSGQIHHLIKTHLEAAGYPCQVFDAPLDVVFAEDDVVQPDVFIVCDREKIQKHIFGAPDVIFEIASPSTTLKDRREKMDLYERFGVKEYFLVDPEAEFIEKYTLMEGKYTGRAGIYAGDDRFRIDAIGLEIIAKDVFAG